MASIIETQETAEEVRLRLVALKSETGASWSVLATQSGVASGTLSQFGVGSYQGDSLRVAADVRRFLDGRAALAMLRPGVVKAPGFLETPTSRRLMTVLQWAQMGEIVAVAGGPGIGKTTLCTEYQTLHPNVVGAAEPFLIGGVQPLLLAVLASMGITDVRGSPQQLSARILARVRNTDGLLIIDEAQEASEKALDEIRSWHDRTGIGIALVGDERVIGRLSGIRKVDLGRLHSRISMRHIQAHPDDRDAEIIARGWGIEDLAQIRFLKTLARKPGALRGIAKTIKLAGMMANGEDRAITLADLQEAWAQRNTETTGA